MTDAEIEKNKAQVMALTEKLLTTCLDDDHDIVIAALITAFIAASEIHAHTRPSSHAAMREAMSYIDAEVEAAKAKTENCTQGAPISLIIY